MSVVAALGIGLAGGIGAVARFLLGGGVARRFGRGLEFGTLAVNVSGSFALGVLAGAALHGDGYRVAATGLLGAFTTFSAWAYETERLGEDRRAPLAAMNVVASLALGLLAVWAGRRLGAAL